MSHSFFCHHCPDKDACETARGCLAQFKILKPSPLPMEATTEMANAGIAFFWGSDLFANHPGDVERFKGVWRVMALTWEKRRV